MHLSTYIPLYYILAASDTTDKSSGDNSAYTNIAGEIIFLTGSVLFIAWVVSCINRPAGISLKETPERKNRLHILHGIAAYLVWHYAATICFYFHDSSLIASAIGRLAGITFILVIANLCFNRGIVEGMGFSAKRWAQDSARSIYLYLAIYPVCAILLRLCEWIITHLVPKFSSQTHPVLESLKTADTGTMVLLFITTAVLTPVFEELLFRGLIQSCFRSVIGPWPAVLLASVLFGAVHFTLPHTIIPLTAFGIALGFIYERTGRLWAPILCHAIFNSVTMLTVVLAG